MVPIALTELAVDSLAHGVQSFPVFAATRCLSYGVCTPNNPKQEFHRRQEDRTVKVLQGIHHTAPCSTAATDICFVLLCVHPIRDELSASKLVFGSADSVL